jgi:hypothetical protein
MADINNQEVITITNTTWRPSLITAGQQDTIAESEAWRLRNYMGDLDGMLMKRPGRTQWGQTIKSADGSATDSTITAFVDFLTLDGFVFDESGADGLLSDTQQDGLYRVNVSPGSSNENFLASYSTASVSTTEEWSLRFMFRGSDLPTYDGSSIVGNTFVMRAQADTDSAKEFAIWSGGLYYQNASDSQYTLVTGSANAGAGIWVNLEIRCDTDSGDTTVHLNDTLIDTITSSDIKNEALTGTSLFEFEWEVEGSGDASTQYTTQLTTVMYNDTITDPFKVEEIVALHEFQYVSPAGSTVRSLVMAAGAYIYHDTYINGVWRPLHKKQHANVHFAKYQDTLVWINHNNSSLTSMIRWDGIQTPELIEDAPNVRFVIEHQSRLMAWGDIQFPRRLYYSGDRLPKVWFSPDDDNVEDDFDVVLDAGFVTLPSTAREVKGVWGDYFGLVIIAGDKGFWKMGGQGVFSFELKGVSVKSGVASALSMSQVGADIWGVGRQGITSLAATQQFGDLLAGKPSANIQDLWTRDLNSDELINQTFLDKVKLVFQASTDYAYVAVPLASNQDTDHVYAYNASLQKWYGPWDMEVRAMAVVELISPVTEVVLLGDSQGRVAYLNMFDKSDFGEAYSGEVEVAALNGRSIHPSLVGQYKNWGVLRLYLQPTGSFEIDIKYWFDADPKEYIVPTINTIETSEPRIYVLDDDFRVDLDPDGLISSGQEMVMHEILLEGAQAREFTWQFVQDGAGEDCPIQGWEVELVPSGYGVA